MSDPVVEQYELAGLSLSFTLVNASLSLANAIRRTIMADVPCVVLHTNTDEDDGPLFHANTSRRTNEIIAQRLACIPLYIADPQFPYQDYTYVIDKTNTSSTIEYITSADIILRETKSGRDVATAETSSIFPPDPITGDFIDILRLRPSLAQTMKGETLHMSGKLSISTAAQNGCHALTSTCVCIGTRNEPAVKQAAAALEKTLLIEKKTSDEIILAKSDFMRLDAARLTIPNSFDFNIQAIGPIGPRQLVFRAIDILANRLRQLVTELTTDTERLQDAPGTIPYAFNVQLHGDGYTLGRLIEGYLYDNHFTPQSENAAILSFCGFRKPHPHIAVSNIKIAFTRETARAGALAFIEQAIEEVIVRVNSLSRFFSN